MNTRRVVGWALAAGTCVSSAQPTHAQQSRSDLFSQQPGRYQIVISPHGARDTFLVDTGTGRVWQLVKFTDLVGEPDVWRIMPRVDNDVDQARLAAERGMKSAPSISAPAAPPSRTPSNARP
jgi:hypothetical protein